jgi:hypothetical protein
MDAFPSHEAANGPEDHSRPIGRVSEEIGMLGRNEEGVLNEEKW